MAQAQDRSKGQPRHLTVEFAGWLGDVAPSSKEFFEDSLIILDANVLLDLYTVGADARNEVLDALTSVRRRLWVPSQAALEFSRRRRQIVLDRISAYKRAKVDVRTAAGSAADVIETAVNRVHALRERNRTSRDWDISAAQLDREGIESRLDGIMDAALTELRALEDEHDLTPKDMQAQDAVLARIDKLLVDRIGSPYSSDQLHVIVDEAISFRYPNLIPPGYLDADKTTSLYAAGDYILWRQVIDKAADPSSSARRVLLITNDRKEDWWTLDSRGKPLRARPELALELYQSSEANLLLLTLADFLDGAEKHLKSKVSKATVNEIRTATSYTDVLLQELRQSADGPDLLKLSPVEFESLIEDLLLRMGYGSTANVQDFADGGTRIRLVDQARPDIGADSVTTIVEIKLYRNRVPVSVVREVYGAMRYLNVENGIIITTSSFSAESRYFAEDTSIDLIDGPRLLELLLEYSNLRAHIGG